FGRHRRGQGAALPPDLVSTARVARGEVRRRERDVDARTVADRTGADRAVERHRPPLRERQTGRLWTIAGRCACRRERDQQGCERKCPTRYGGTAPLHTL